MKKDDLVAIKFLDHCFTDGGSHQPLQCEVFGRVDHVDKRSVVVAVWQELSNGSGNNNDTYTIVKSCITKVTKLRRVNR